jgi:RimJ/RimL family protein N-acetyltransferase
MARVLAIVSPGNDASMRLLEKLGFTREGTQDIDGRPLVVFAAAPADRQGRR